MYLNIKMTYSCFSIISSYYAQKDLMTAKVHLPVIWLIWYTKAGDCSRVISRCQIQDLKVKIASTEYFNEKKKKTEVLSLMHWLRNWFNIYHIESFWVLGSGELSLILTATTIIITNSANIYWVGTHLHECLFNHSGYTRDWNRIFTFMGPTF